MALGDYFQQKIVHAYEWVANKYARCVYIVGQEVSAVSSANTPSIQTSATAIAANTSRKGWSIQNVGTNPLFVRLGSGASATVFNYVLKGGTGNNDGLGSSVSQMDGGTIYQGIITIAGTDPRYVVTEL